MTTPTPEQVWDRGALRRRNRLPVALVSVVLHLGVLLVLLTPRTQPAELFEPEPIQVTLVEAPRPVEPAPAPAPPEPKPPAPVKAEPKPVDKPTPVKPPPKRNIFRETKAPQAVAVLPAGKGPVSAPADATDELSEGQVASASVAGSGPAGGACDMARWLQAALRKDRQVQAAVASVHRGKAIMVWNGDWVRHSGQEGNGLAAVREALMWEVAFAPKACRSEPVRGLVLFTLADGPGAPRVVVGQGTWHWSDMLFSRSVPASGAIAER